MMEDLLYIKDLHEPIESEEARPADLDDKKWNVIGTIRLWIDQSVSSFRKRI